MTGPSGTGDAAQQRRTLAFLSLADADEIFTVATTDGAVLPVYGIAGPAGAPVLLFGHANGLAAGSYGPWLRRLATRARIYAFDARGHGGSSWPAGPIEEVFAVDRMADDLAEVTRAVAARAGAAAIAYAGHSLGGASALRLAAARRAPQWSACVIFEPPIFPPPGTRFHDEATAKQIRLVAGTERRREVWPSPEALAERLKGRGMFARFDPAMLAAHCRATLKPGARRRIPSVLPACGRELHLPQPLGGGHLGALARSGDRD